MYIEKVVLAPGWTGFYADDKEAIRSGAKRDGFIYQGKPITPGFKMIRQPGETVSIMLFLENGDIAYGDCAVAQYVGSGGRNTLISADQMISLIKKHILPCLEGKDLTSFINNSKEIDNLTVNDQKIPAAIRYGASQAILHAVAKMKKKMMFEVVMEEYNLDTKLHPIRINAQSGDDRYSNVDKMILKKAGLMPHGLINNVEEIVGNDGSLFLNYVRWVKNRVLSLREDDFCPVFRFDVYGTIGLAFNNDIPRIINYFRELEKAAAPFKLAIEMPFELGSKDAQLEIFVKFRRMLKEEGIDVMLIIDEYANTLEDIKEWADAGGADIIQVKTVDLGGIHNIVEANLYCKQSGILAYQGGTCNETDQSSRVCVHLAMATQPFAISGKPGMGVDEGMMIVHNEMQRIIAYAKSQGLMISSHLRCRQKLL